MIILHLLLRYYKNMFARLWIFSPSIKLDPQYAPLRKYLEAMSNQDKEPLMFEDLEQTVLGKLLDEQRTITEECRKRKIKPPQVCVVLDDLAERGDILTKRSGGNKGSWLISLATRGRHFGVTWIISSQVLNLVGTVIRKNCRCMAVWRLRNHKEVETLCEELSGIYEAKTIMAMFWLRFEARLSPQEESDDEPPGHGQPVDDSLGKALQVRKTGPSPVKTTLRAEQGPGLAK